MARLIGPIWKSTACSFSYYNVSTSKHLSTKSPIKIEGERNYSYIYLSNQSKKLASKALAHFEEILSNQVFFRYHRSFLVNGHHIRSIGNNGHFLLSDDTVVPISWKKKKKAAAWFKEYAVSRK